VSTHRELGLTVPVSEVLDPDLWREGYAFNLVLGQGPRLAESQYLAGVGPACAPTLTAQTLRGREVEQVADEMEAYAAELPDNTIRMHLRAALSELEVKMQIPLGTVVCKATPVDEGLVKGVDYDKEVPRSVFLQSDMENYFRIDLPPSVISVERVRAYWFNQLMWSITAPSEVLRLEHTNSSLHLMPTTGSFLLIWPMPTLPVYTLMQHLVHRQHALPDVWAVDYTLGPVTKTGTVGHIELVLAHWARLKAAMTLLPLAGAGRTKGIASSSLSIDGLSKSVSLAGGGSQSIWTSVEQAYQKALDGIDLNRLIIYKRGLTIRGLEY
jgi:hypothetical protein